MRFTFCAALWILLGSSLANAQCPIPANAPDGTTDTCFMQTKYGVGSQGSFNALAGQPSGKVLVSQNYTGDLIFRLNTDGSKDSTFHTIPQTHGYNTAGGYVSAIMPLRNGRHLVAGQFDSIAGFHTRNLARIFEDGTVDTTLRCTLDFNFGFNMFLLQANGNMLVAGDFFWIADGQIHYYMANIKPDLTLDSSFAGSLLFDPPSIFRALEEQPDGKLLVAGNLAMHDVAGSYYSLVQLNQDGTFDSSFIPTPTNGESVNAVLTLPNGKILASYERHGLVLLRPNGAVDSSAQIPAELAGNNLFITKLLLQGDGKILVGGNFGSPDGYHEILRLNPDLSIDSTFIKGLPVSGDWSGDIILHNGRVLGAGRFGMDVPNPNGSWGVAAWVDRATITSSHVRHPEAMSLSPNPGSGLVFIKAFVNVMKVTLYAPDGRRVSVPVLHTGTSAQFSVEGQAPGIYTIEVETVEGRVLHSRLAVNR